MQLDNLLKQIKIQQNNIYLLPISLYIVLCRNLEPTTLPQLQSDSVPCPPPAYHWRLSNAGKLPTIKPILNNTNVIWAFIGTDLYESAATLARLGAPK